MLRRAVRSQAWASASYRPGPTWSSDSSSRPWTKKWSRPGNQGLRNTGCDHDLTLDPQKGVSPMEGRTGEAYELGEQLTVVGSKLRPGDKAPDFELDHVDPVDDSASTVSLADSQGKVRLFNVINSLDTPVCHVETRRWESIRSDLPEDV